MAEEGELLSATLPRAGSVVDVEFLASLMGRHVWNRIILEQGNDGFDAYKLEFRETDGAPTIAAITPGATTSYDPRSSLEDAAWWLLETQWEAGLTPTLLQSYPWTEGTYRAPPLERTAGNTLRERGRALELQRAAYDPEEDEYSPASLLEDFVRDRLNRGEEFSFYLERGWWPRLLMLESEVEDWRRYWENYTTARLPTVEEGNYLLARHLHQSRTLLTGTRLDRMEWALRNLPHDSFAAPENGEWGLRPHIALQLVVLEGSRWSFADVQCEPKNPAAA